MKQEIICKKCNGKNIKKDVVRETKNRGKVQRYKCKDCSHRLGEQNWFVDVMDTTTRFMVASDYMKSRTIEKLF